MTRTGNTKQINITVPDYLETELRKEAKKVNRSFSNYIAHLLINRQAVGKEGK